MKQQFIISIEGESSKVRVLNVGNATSDEEKFALIYYFHDFEPFHETGTLAIGYVLGSDGGLTPRYYAEKMSIGWRGISEQDFSLAWDKKNG